MDIGGLAVRGRTEEDYPVHTVGAYGVSRTDTMSRAAGEAVERFALFPREHGPEARTATAAELGEHAFDFARYRLGDPAAAGERLRWYRGRWLDTGQPVWLPAGLVDYPVAEEWFDPTPSGAAAGPSEEFALRAAMLELIERDAVGIAWAAELTLQEYDVEAELALARPGADWRHLARLHRWALNHGLRPRLLRVPGPPGLHCVLAAVLDGPSLGAVGAKAHPDPGRALLVALQESLQIRDALRKLRAGWGGGVPEVVRDDLDRARLWLTEPAAAELARRLRDLPPVPPGAPAPEPVDLLSTVVRDGGRPAVVDLTGRLPEAHRVMGWHAVKVVVAGYQALRMDERCEFTWQRERLVRAGARTPNPFPHPLI